MIDEDVSRSARVDPSAGELLVQLSEQTSRLVRDELRLAQAELKAAAKHAGMGAGLFGAAGVLALFGFGVLVATAVIALALVVPWWLAGLIVAVVLFATAGIAALVAKSQVQQVSPPVGRTAENVKQDLDEVKEAAGHGHAHRP